MAERNPAAAAHSRSAGPVRAPLWQWREPQSGDSCAPGGLSPQYSRFRQRGHTEARSHPRSHRPPQAGRVSHLHPRGGAADRARVVTFLMTREGTSRPYRELGIADGHHPCTHHQGKPELIEKVTQINTYHATQMAGWVAKLKSTHEGDRRLLDNMMLVYGAGLSDGNRHLHEDLPTMVIGNAGGTIKTGRRIVYRRETPMCNLHLAMME